MINLINFIKDSYCLIQLQGAVSIILLLYSHLPTSIISLIVGIFFLAKNRKQETKILFFLTLAFLIFTFGDLTEWFVFLGRGPVIFARSIIELADPLLFILSSYFLFVLVKKRDVRLIYKIIWLLPIIIYAGILIVSFSKNLISYNWDICEVVESNLITVYGFYMDLFYMISAIIFAIWSITKGKGDRKRITITSAGVCLFIILFFVMEYVFTGYIFGSAFDYSWFVYAFFGMPILIGFLGYLTVRYNEFDIKLIATQALVWGLIALIGAQFFFGSGMVSYILTGITFVAAIIFGQLLARSVKKEVEQRERIEKIEKELEKANKGLIRANETLELFMNGLQHDVKGYLTPIIAGSPSLLEGDGIFSEKRKKGIYLNENGVHMVQIFQSRAVAARDQADDFLAIAKFRTGKPIVSPDSFVEIGSMLDELANSFKFESGQGGISVEFEKPESEFIVPADQTKLKSALRNVIGNSIKYTKKGKVAISLTKKGGNKVLIKIQDTGIGIPAEKLTTLFNSPFERTEEAKKTAGGAGFGLYFASLIIGLHNGKIWAESKGEGNGSIFYIELPTKSGNLKPESPAQI